MKAWYMVSYDIRDDKRLRRVARLVEGYGVRLQYSLFRCFLSQRDLERLRWELTGIMEEDDDLLIIQLCPHCTNRLRTANPGAHWPDEPPGFRVL